MSLEDEVAKAQGDPAALEALYKEAEAAGEVEAFKEALAGCVREDPESLLLAAWTCRLEIQVAPAAVELLWRTPESADNRTWTIAVAASAVLGIAFALFAGSKPPIPVPGAANPLFWIGWAPVTALGVLFYLAKTDRAGERHVWYWGAGVAIAILGAVTALVTWGRTDGVAGLIALHLPFVMWAFVGGSLALGRPDPARQFYAYVVKSMETVLTVGVYLLAGVAFGALTVGIFNALSISISEDTMRIFAAWGFGAVPLLALASVYDPASPPAEQSWSSGLARILTILTRLMLPLALGVLVVYVCVFIPLYFWRPFGEREVLIVYNATIVAVLALLAASVTGPDDARSERDDRILRYGILALCLLSILLNLYALAAIISRTAEFGLTPNRHAVLGWNAVTLVMLGTVVVRLLRSTPAGWVDGFRASFSRISILAIAWICWVVWGLPRF